MFMGCIFDLIYDILSRARRTSVLSFCVEYSEEKTVAFEF